MKNSLARRNYMQLLLIVLSLWIAFGILPHYLFNQENGLQAESRTVRQSFASYSFEQLLPLVKPWAMVRESQIKFGWDAVMQINRNKVSGDIVECGVWKGGMTMAMVFANQRDNTERKFWLFDTFEGLPPPDSEKDGAQEKSLYELVQSGEMNNPKCSALGKWCYGPLEIVKNNLHYTGYPKENFRYVKGKVEDTLLSEKLPDKIAVLRLDTDWDKSTKIELDVLFRRLQKGGILIIDDFCSWQGSSTATKEFFRDKLNLDAEEERKKSGNPCFHFWK